MTALFCLAQTASPRQRSVPAMTDTFNFITFLALPKCGRGSREITFLFYHKNTYLCIDIKIFY
jgi:hypothetical protein